MEQLAAGIGIVVLVVSRWLVSLSSTKHVFTREIVESNLCNQIELLVTQAGHVVDVAWSQCMHTFLYFYH
jgi:hypothetical protein